MNRIPAVEIIVAARLLHFGLKKNILIICGFYWKQTDPTDVSLIMSLFSLYEFPDSTFLFKIKVPRAEVKLVLQDENYGNKKI